MSDPRAKAERSAAKDKRQGIDPDYHRPKGKRKTKPKKPYRVMIHPFIGLDETWCIHQSATREQAEEWIEKQKRSYSYGRPRKMWIEGDE